MLEIGGERILPNLSEARRQRSSRLKALAERQDGRFAGATRGIPSPLEDASTHVAAPGGMLVMRTGSDLKPERQK
jgi:hypothetical protein